MFTDMGAGDRWLLRKYEYYLYDILNMYIVLYIH